MTKEMLKLLKLLVKNNVDFNIGYDRGNFSVNVEVPNGICAVFAKESDDGLLHVVGSVNKNFPGAEVRDCLSCCADGALKYFMAETLSFPMLELEVKEQRDKSPALRNLYERLCIITEERRSYVSTIFENACWKDFNSFWRKYVGFLIGFADPECEKFRKALYGEFPPQ